jgi:hypothetical protein
MMVAKAITNAHCHFDPAIELLAPIRARNYLALTAPAQDAACRGVWWTRGLSVALHVFGAFFVRSACQYQVTHAPKINRHPILRGRKMGMAEKLRVAKPWVFGIVACRHSP